MIKYKWVFSAVLLISTALILPTTLEMEYPYLAFPALCGILFVVFAPNFMTDSLVDRVHTGAAVIAFTFSQIWVGLHNPIILLEWVPYLIYILFTRQNFKFWAEIVMLLTIYTILLI